MVEEVEYNVLVSDADKKPRYSAVTKDGFFIQSDCLDHFKLQELTSFCITETMTEEEVVKRFGRDYALPSDFKEIKGATILEPKSNNK